MYGLPQSGLLANKLLKRQSNAHRCDTDKPTKQTGTRPLETLFTPKQFTLVVDNFGVKYVVIEHCQQPQIRCGGGNSEKPIAPYLDSGMSNLWVTSHTKRWLRKQSGLAWVDRKSTKDQGSVLQARHENLHVFSDWIIRILNYERAQDLLSTTIQNILETLGKTSSRVASSKHARRIPRHTSFSKCYV